MSFQPPRCPNRSCPKHRAPDSRRIVRWGYYTTSCRGLREQRYRCLQCRKTFSRQTFRHDYRDRRPELNELLFLLLSSGMGFQQAAYVLKVNQSTTQHKMRKLARTCRLLHRNLCKQLPAGRSYLLEPETLWANW